MDSTFIKKSCPLWLLCVGIVFATFGLLSNKSHAHSLGQSYVFLNLNTDLVSGRIEITVSDINRALSLELPVDGSVTTKDLKPFEARIREYVQNRVAFRSTQGETDDLRLGALDILTLDMAQFVLVSFTVENSLNVERIGVEYNILFDKDSDHRAFLVIENDWETGTFDNEAKFSMIFEPGSNSQVLELNDSTPLSGIFAMVRLGVHHIWVGIDHVLFLIVLLLPAVLLRDKSSAAWRPVTSFRPALIYVVKIVTLFTVAHTITLSIATLTDVSLSSRIVESIIAISIAVAALDIYYPIFHKRIWAVVFVFGLFHGFGFASVLSDIGIPPAYMGQSLLAFNVGVELGQLAIVCVVFPVMYLLRATWFYKVIVLRLGTAALIAVSLYWFVERGFEMDLPLDENFRWFLIKYNIADVDL